MVSVAIVFIAALVALAAANGNNNGHHQVCVLGGGASGLAAAVFLKDLGYSPLVIEQASFVGGHCNTIHYPVPRGSTLPGYIDIGVEVYSNSTYSQLARPQEGWAIQSDKFAARFAPTYSVNYGAASSSLNYLVDFNANVVIPVVSSDESTAALEAYEVAFETLYGLVLQYPWLSTGHRPDPVPAALLVPFVETVQEYNLWSLQVIFEGLIIDSGIGSLATISTLEALQILSAPSLDLFNPEAPTAGFFIQGGCGVLYNNIVANYLGSENVVLNADIKRVVRSSQQVVVSGTISNSEQHDEHGHHGGDHGHHEPVEFSYECDKIIVAFYPTLQNLAAFDLTSAERALFGQLSAHYYLALGITYTGGSLIDQAFTVYTYNASNPAVANGPFLSTITREIPEGPAAAYVNADIGLTGKALSLDAAVALAQETLNNFPGGLLTGGEVFVSNYHLYEPHFTQSLYATSPTPDTTFNNLQGQHNTYWVGAATRYDATVVVWNGAYEVVNAHFPKVHHK